MLTVIDALCWNYIVWFLVMFWVFLKNFLQVARKLVILEGELERAEERAEVSEL